VAEQTSSKESAEVSDNMTLDESRLLIEPRVAPQSVRSLVEDRLRKAIMDGRFPPGAHLADRVLCEQFGVSRSIVREAIRLLEAEGWVSVVPHRGSFVTYLTVAEAVQIYEVRAALEALAGQGFAERASEEERAELRAVYERLAAMDPSIGQDVLLKAKREFYAVLLRGCRNDYADRMLCQLLNRIMHLRATSLSAPGRLPNTIRELRRIIEAIEQRDGEGAAAACREHVRSAAMVALRVMREREHQAGEALHGADAGEGETAPAGRRRLLVR
jgi:DNA-binding GntR family transcriptional regulator